MKTKWVVGFLLLGMTRIIQPAKNCAAAILSGYRSIEDAFVRNPFANIRILGESTDFE